MDLKELIVIPNVAYRLKSPPKTNERLGASSTNPLATAYATVLRWDSS